MVLDLGGGGIFPQVGLLNDTGLLKERWAQEGSTLLTFNESNSSDHTVHTVTTDKVFYMKGFIISNPSTNNKRWILRDGGAAGTIKFDNVETTRYNITSILFPAPIKFSTDIYMEETTTPCGSNIVICGWEEAA